MDNVNQSHPEWNAVSLGEWFATSWKTAVPSSSGSSSWPWRLSLWMSGNTQPIARHCIPEDPNLLKDFIHQKLKSALIDRGLSLECIRFKIFMAVKIQMLVPCHNTQHHCSSTTVNCLDFFLESVIIFCQHFSPETNATAGIHYVTLKGKTLKFISHDSTLVTHFYILLF